MCAYVEGEPRDWIREVQDEISYLRVKGIDIDEMFSVLVKIMKKVKSDVGLTDMKLKISFLSGLEGEIVEVYKAP